MPTRTLCVLALLTLVGCGPTRFIRSDAAFAGARKPGPPSMFLDQGPPVPWRSVGMIEVELSGNVADAQVLAAALEAGQEAGCDLLVQVRKRQASAARPFGIVLAGLTVGHDHGDHSPPPQPREEPASRGGAAPSAPSTDTAGRSSGGGEAPVSGGGRARRVRRWGFDCGVYTSTLL